MVLRHLVIGFLFIGVAIVPAVLGPLPSPAASASTPPIPEEAREALEQGRYWRASQILRGYLAAVPDTTPEAILLAAQAEAGWGGWAQVTELLSGQPWLDTVGGGYGRNLLGRGRFELGEFQAGGRDLGRYLEIAGAADDHERGLAAARQALALREAGDAAGALGAFDDAIDRLPQAADWLNVLAAAAAAAAGDTAEVARRLGGVDTDLARDHGWRYRVRAHRRADDPEGALRAARRAADVLGSAAERAEAWSVAGDLRLEMGDSAAARAVLRRAIEAAPSAIAAVDAARRLSEFGDLSANESLRIGRLYLRHGNLDRAMTGLRAYLDAGGGSAVQRASVRLELGRALFNRGRYADAEAELLDIADAAPSAAIAAEALYLAGRAQYRRGRAAAGRATFVRTADRFPNADPAARAMFLVADLDHDDGELESAREFYRRAIEISPTIDEAGLAVMRLGGIAFADGEFRAAVEVYEGYRQRFPNGRRYAQATYWAARAYEAMGQTGLARERYEDVWRKDPLSYYGARAADWLGRSYADLRLEPSPPASDSVDAEVSGALARLDILRELGLGSAVGYEISRLQRHFAGRDAALYALAEALNARGYTLSGIRLGWDIQSREGAWNPRLLRIVYPMPYRELIIAEAEEQGVDPFLVAGLIRQESMFSAGIRSHAGATGLMQIMPATGRSLARAASLGSFRTSLLEQPEINVHLGIRYLAELMGRFDGRLPPVLAAYNAGPHRVASWSAFPEFVDDELFMERIPYRETRDYVKIVQHNARLYAALYDESGRGAGPGVLGSPAEAEDE